MAQTISRRRFLGRAAYVALVAAPAGAMAASTATERLYRRAIDIDGNLVAPFDPEAPLDAATERLVRSSGLTALKMTLGGSDADYAATQAEIAGLDRAIARVDSPYMKIARAFDLAAAKRARRIGVIYSFESVQMLDGRLDRIDEFSAHGVRVMQLSYNTASPFASGCLAPQPSAGLTPLGGEAIDRMNRLGVTLDLSHADAHSTLEAVAQSRRPSLITHAGCAAVHAHPRNKSDEVLRAVADKGGVVGIYELAFLSPGPEQQTLAQYMAHLTHALSVCGEDHVGIGSDAVLTPFDTSKASMDEWNKDIAARKASGVAAPGEGRPPFVVGLNRPDRSRVIAAELLRRRYPVRTVEKVLGSNFQRVFAETWTPEA